MLNHSDLFDDQRLLWINRCGMYSTGVHHTKALSAVACIEGGPDCEQMAESNGIEFFTVEDARGRREWWPDEFIQNVLPELGPSLRDHVKRTGGRKWWIVSPYALEAISEFADALGVQHSSPPLAQHKYLSDKRVFLEGLGDLGLNQAPGRWLCLSGVSYSALCREFGARFVIQRPVSGGGAGTAFAGSDEEFSQIASSWRDEVVLVARDIGDHSVNVNALALRTGSVVGWPSVQLTGLSCLGCRPGTYCGNDYGAANELERSILESVREQTQRIGSWIASLGYEGLFGLDFVIDRCTGYPTAIDLNPRWQGSTALLTQAELSAGRLPLAVAELAWRTGRIQSQAISRSANQFFAPASGSQFMFKWPHVSGVLGREIDAGVYSRPFQRLRDGIGLGSCSGTEEFVVAGLPARGILLHHKAQLLRVVSHRRVIDTRTGQPLPWLTSIANAILSRVVPSVS